MSDYWQPYCLTWVTMVAFGRHRGELHCRESSGHSSCSCETHGTCCSLFWNRWNRCCIILIIRLLFNIVVHLVAKIVMKTSIKQSKHHDKQKTNQTSWCTSQTTTSWDRQCYTISLGAVRWQKIKQKVRVAYAMIIFKNLLLFSTYRKVSSNRSHEKLPSGKHTIQDLCVQMPRLYATDCIVTCPTWLLAWTL